MVNHLEDLYISADEFAALGGDDESTSPLESNDSPTKKEKKPKEPCIKTDEYIKDHVYYKILLISIIIVLLILFFILFDALDIFKPWVLDRDNNLNKDGTPNDGYYYRDLGMEIGGWALLVGASAGVGFMAGREMIFGKNEIYESPFTTCVGNSYLALIIIVVLILTLVIYFFDPWDSWHKTFYNIDENDPCSQRLYEKHRSNMEIGGWVTLIVGTFFLGGSVAYLNYFGRVQTHTSVH